MRRRSFSWRWIIIQSVVGVLVAFAFAVFFYPHLLPWLVVAALVIAALQSAALIAIWRRMEGRLRESGFRC